jgi:hypothetical protein
VTDNLQGEFYAKHCLEGLKGMMNFATLAEWFQKAFDEGYAQGIQEQRAQAKKQLARKAWLKPKATKRAKALAHDFHSIGADKNGWLQPTSEQLEREDEERRAAAKADAFAGSNVAPFKRP